LDLIPYVAIWIFLATILYTVLLFPFLLATDRIGVRIVGVLFFASLVAPGGVGGHGFLPTPPLFWVLLGFYKSTDAPWFLLSWLLTAAWLFAYDLGWRALIRRSELSKGQMLVRFFFGPQMWFTVQVIAFAVFEASRRPSKYYDQNFDYSDHYIAVAAWLYVSTAILALIRHRFVRDYYVCNLFLGAVYVFCYYLLNLSGFQHKDTAFHVIRLSMIFAGNLLVHYSVAIFVLRMKGKLS
jgi:hypothetical protein